MNKFINYLIVLLLYILNNTIGIFINNYFEFNFIDNYIFALFLSIYSFLIGTNISLFDNNHPKDTIKKLYNAPKIIKLKYFISSIPISILYNFVYNSMDPILIQLIGGSSIIFNYIFSILINKNYHLINYKIIIFIFINIFGCILPFIFEIKNNVSTFGLIFQIILMLLSGIISAFMEKFKYCNYLDINNECFTIVNFYFQFYQIIIIILLLPLNLIFFNKFDFNKFLFIFLIASLYSIIYGPLYIISSYSMISLSSLDNGIINGLRMIIIILFSCIFSPFKYIYIISIAIIIISSLILIYLDDKLKIINIL